MEAKEEFDDFVFRLYGNNIAPETLKASELAKVITLLENAFQVYFETMGEKGDDKFYLSLVEIENKSVGLKFLPKRVRNFIVGFSLITTAIQTETYALLPPKTIQDFQKIQKIIKAKNCSAQFIHRGETFATINSNTQIGIPEKGIIKGESILYGEIQRVGGKKNPSAIILLDTGETIACSVSRTVAKQLGSKLYNSVVLKGYATWSARDYSLLAFKIESFDDFSNSTNEEAFNSLRKSLGKYWDRIEDVDDFLLRD